MDDDREEFIDEITAILSEARKRMTPIERAFCDVRCERVMENARNSFWISYCLKDTGGRLLTKEELQDKGREEEIRILWLLKHAPFSFKSYGAGQGNRTLFFSLEG